jgi:DNA polymerase I-like protein with 3'-5' exonuclease and polymerase domains
VTWVTEWKTGPDSDEGWLHPGDGKLHAVFNQFEAETGRSSSEKPNGQNLPQDKEVRYSFVADPPNESIRISTCCESEAHWKFEADCYYCFKCGEICSTHAEEYVYVTADMSGAELRIIAEGADDPVWIGAFNRGEDVHSVGTEVLRPDEWPKLLLPSIAKPGGWTLQDCKDEVVLVIPAKEQGGKDKKIGPCAYYALKPDGTYAKQKCDCPEHASMRNDNKSTNFLLSYGGGAGTLAKRIKKSIAVASELMGLHEQRFPNIWKYLAKLGREARLTGKAFDMFGGRRIFPPPTEERARENFIDYHADQLELDKEEQVQNIAEFTAKHDRKPTPDEKFALTHRLPTNGEISKQFIAMSSHIERQGKNMPIQGTNARIAKLAMGSGYDSIQHKPYLWHTLPQYRARLVKFVHDELVVQCPKQYGTVVAELIGDAFKRAAAEKMKKVVMEFDYHIANYWMK